MAQAFGLADRGREVPNTVETRFALASGEIILAGGSFAGRRFRAPENLRCITAIAASGPDMFIANGSATNSAEDWQIALLQRNASGSIWRIEPESGRITRLASVLT